MEQIDCDRQISDSIKVPFYECGHLEREKVSTNVYNKFLTAGTKTYLTSYSKSSAVTSATILLTSIHWFMIVNSVTKEDHYKSYSTPIKH